MFSAAKSVKTLKHSSVARRNECLPREYRKATEVSTFRYMEAENADCVAPLFLSSMSSRRKMQKSQREKNRFWCDGTVQFSSNGVYALEKAHMRSIPSLRNGPRGLFFTWWGCCGLCQRREPTELARSFLFLFLCLFLSLWPVSYTHLTLPTKLSV